MDKEPLIRLTWHGHETVSLIPGLINEFEKIEITLPLEYNHALFEKLHPDARAADLEDIDAHGGPELLSRIATISGLEEMEKLTKDLHAVQAEVHIVSPPTLLITMPS